MGRDGSRPLTMAVRNVLNSTACTFHATNTTGELFLSAAALFGARIGVRYALGTRGT